MIRKQSVKLSWFSCFQNFFRWPLCNRPADLQELDSIFEILSLSKNELKELIWKSLQFQRIDKLVYIKIESKATNKENKQIYWYGS